MHDSNCLRVSRSSADMPTASIRKQRAEKLGNFILRSCLMGDRRNAGKNLSGMSLAKDRASTRSMAMPLYLLQQAAMFCHSVSLCAKISSDIGHSRLHGDICLSRDASMVVATRDEWTQFVVTSIYISCTTRGSSVLPARPTFGKVQGYILSLLLLFLFAV